MLMLPLMLSMLYLFTHLNQTLFHIVDPITLKDMHTPTCACRRALENTLLSLLHLFRSEE